MMRLLKLFLFLLFSAGIAYIAWQRLGPSMQVEVVHPRQQAVVDAIYATGTVEPSVMIAVAPRLTGRLSALLVDEGDLVQKDQVLARMEDRDLEKVLEDAQASLDLARKEFDRRSALVKKGAVARDVLDQAEATLSSAEARAAQAEASLSYMRLVAPEDGTVIRRDGEVGEVITVNTPVFYLSCCAGLRISAEVDEEDISRVEIGQKVLIRADAFSGRVFDGMVDAITPKGDPVARSYRVRISLPQDTPLMIGMTAESNIILQQKESALVIPVGALDGNIVYAFRDGVFTPVQVETGVRTTDAVEIISGLTSDDRVAADANMLNTYPERRKWKPVLRAELAPSKGE